MASSSESGGLVVHHLNNSRSQRILWLLVGFRNTHGLIPIYKHVRLPCLQEELEVPYTIKNYERLPSQLAPPELRAVHPLGKSPVITDNDTVVAESGAIVGGNNHYCCSFECFSGT
jgi:glutathione S-transferase